ncbi:MAG TPA: dipeptidase [Bryobacteraceae bacterium]|nr:dipeptidase [Bryobacteraceae bacterium]
MTDQERYLEELKEFLRIPSISTEPEHRQHMYEAASFAAKQLEGAGLNGVRLIEGDGHPLVYGEWLGAPGKPTLLFYGHYDVQPPEPLEEWLSPPFEPRLANGNIYARGAADDKGLTLVLIKAVERLMGRDGRLPVNVRFLIEGEEETNGRHIGAYVRAHAADLASDVAVISDTEMFAPETPTLMTGLRGIVYGEIQVETAAHDLHSGTFGGVAPNALQAVCEIICGLKDREGVIRIPGFYDSVARPSQAEKQAWAELPFDEEAFCRNEAKSSQLTGEKAFSALERMFCRPTFEVHGIRGGFVGEGAKTVIPARAVAKVSMRLVPDQRPAEVVAQVRAAVRKLTPPGATADFVEIQSAAPSLVPVENQFMRAAAQAMEEVFGRPTVYIRCGGSIPIVGLFQQCLGIPSVLMGFGLPDDNLHAPNEKLNLSNFYRGIDSVTRFLEILA